jgi:putative cardiolipin synthase
MNARIRGALRLGWVLVCAWLAVGCSGLPVGVDRPVSTAIAASPATPLGAVLAQAGIPPGRSGFRPLPEGSFAFDARLELIKRAQVSLDLQYYFIGNDEVGRTILAGLRDAALRGVRVRLLIDDLDTDALEDMLLGLAAFDNVQVRLFNPFVYGRGNAAGRGWNFLTDFRRLNRRMHNKLFVADGAMAIAGGRNLADEYFLRSPDANFIDFDLLMAGQVVADASRVFDQYWNSEQVFPIHSLMSSAPPPLEAQAKFAELTQPGALAKPGTIPPTDLLGAPTLGAEIEQKQFHFIVADATVHADPPRKNVALVDPATGISTPPTTARTELLTLISAAREEIFLVSPYVIPGKEGLQDMQAAHDRGAAVRIVTNSLAASDNPLVAYRYSGYRVDMLRAGVRLFELSSSRFRLVDRVRQTLGKSTARLHAKIGVIDRKILLVGSVNMDPRSSLINTEIGIAIDSPELALKVHSLLAVFSAPGFYEVVLKPNGGLRWVARDGVEDEELDDEPGANVFQRIKLYLQSLIVPEDQL